jgi:hypothetical protein
MHGRNEWHGWPGEWRYTRRGCLSQVAASVVAALVLAVWYAVGWLVKRWR